MDTYDEKGRHMTRKTSRWAGLAVLIAWLGAAGAATAQQQRAPQEMPATRLVQINLLAASKTGDSDLSDLPANTRKAIEDIKDFLPFKRYQILDTSLVRAVVPTPDRGGRAAKTFMTGPDGEKLQVQLRMTAERDSHEILVSLFEVTPSMKDRFFALTPEQRNRVDTQSDAPAIAPRAELLDMGAFISTSFTANIGQTVVVGSSRLNGGDEALIVLFTALP
jgi:hypothetical protein